MLRDVSYFAGSLGAPANVKELTVVLCCILFFPERAMLR